MTNLFTEAKAAVAVKVRKLLTQAEDPGATPEEAQTFTEAAQRLMAKYSIELAMIADADKTDQLVEGRIDVSDPHGRRKIHLANVVASCNDCRGIFTRYKRGSKDAYYLSVVGYESDVEWVKTLYASLELQLASAMARDARTRPAYDNGRTWAVNYIEGFCGAIHARLTEAKRAAAAEAQADVAGQRSPTTRRRPTSPTPVATRRPSATCGH